MKMTKALSPLAVELKAAVATLKATKELVAALRVKVQAERESNAAAKVAAAEAKRAAAIAKAEARLAKLLSKQVGAVGTKAKKAAKRPSKGTVTKYGAEDNAIAAAIMARKASA